MAEAQLCPGCGVPTQRSEGCRKITCVCGRVGRPSTPWATLDGKTEVWEWEGIGDESSDEVKLRFQAVVSRVL